MNFRSNGKLLITGEYLILHGAKALAVPTSFSQSLNISYQQKHILSWKSYFQNELWFKGIISIPGLKIIESNNPKIAQNLIHILRDAQNINPGFLTEALGFEVKSKANFNANWGLGSSSSLLSNISHWANIDPFQMHDKVSAGSGYDIACARSDNPILYQIVKGQKMIQEIEFKPGFKNHLYFVYLGQKQNSAKSVHSFLQNKKKFKNEIELISNLSLHIATTQNIDDFEYYIKEHENILSSVLKTKSIKEERFNDFDGEIKSLGAWGGDFAMVCWQGIPSELQKYFKRRDLNTIFTFDEMIKKNPND